VISRGLTNIVTTAVTITDKLIYKNVIVIFAFSYQETMLTNGISADAVHGGILTKTTEIT